MDQSPYLHWATKQLGTVTSIIKERHGDQSDVYRIVTSDDVYFLKISGSLAKEHERLTWLQDKLPVPKVVGYTTLAGKDALLLTAIEGKNLATFAKEWPPEKIVKQLASALQKFHNTPLTNCPFGDYQEGFVLVHGDACLPNILFSNDVLSGFIDLGDVRIADPRVDFAAAVWSLDYNLGPGYGAAFLNEVGIPGTSEEDVEALRLCYEDDQRAWGLI